MTEFLIFLAMCAAFTLAFRWFLSLRNSDQRMKDHVAKEMAELRAKVAAEDAAQTHSQSQGFGRKPQVNEPTTFVPSAGQFPLALYGGSEIRTPLGHDPANPESREIPVPFRGDWLWEGASENVSRHRISLCADSLIYIDAIGAEPVVGCYNIGPDEVAIVTQQMEDGRWLFATYLFKLLDGGAKLTNLESMDKRWNRFS